LQAASGKLQATARKPPLFLAGGSFTLAAEALPLENARYIHLPGG